MFPQSEPSHSEVAILPTMCFMRLFHRQQTVPPPVVGQGLLLNGLICVAFGLAVLAAPELLAYLVAIVLIVLGVSLLSTWWKLRK